MVAYVVLAIVLTGQIFYTAACLIRRERQPKLKHILRFSALGILVLLLMTGVLPWDFRWKPIFFLCLFLSLLSAAAWLRGSRTKPFRKVRTVLAGIGSLLIMLSFLLPLLLFPLDPPPEPTGPYTVLSQDIYYQDTGRVETFNDSGNYREIAVTYWYPETKSGKFPLILFDHGFNGVRISNESTYRELASHGYVVCAIDHPYHSFMTENQAGKTTWLDFGYMREYTSLGTDLKLNLDLLKKWVGLRVADTEYVLDRTLASEGGLFDLIDKNTIGAFGHSLGGATATALPRVRREIDAVVNLDGPMPYEITEVHKDRYSQLKEPYPVPMLQIYSDYLYHNGLAKDDPLYAVNQTVTRTSAKQYETVLQGTQHMSLTDLVFYSPPLAFLLNGGRSAEADRYESIKTMNRMILEFFDSTLKGQGDVSF